MATNNSSNEKNGDGRGPGEVVQGTGSNGALGWLLPPGLAGTLVRDAAALLRRNLWALLIVYALKDGASFLLHRASQRLTNARV
jgi:hypothetical protein